MRSRGFTLIELLVVLLIIGVITSLATIAFQDNRAEELEREARRLAALVELAGEEAALKSQVIGIRFASDGYGFYRFNAERKWVEIEDDRQLRSRTLPESVDLAFFTQGSPTQGSQASSVDKTEEDTVTPHAYFLPTGELEPGFEANLSHADLERYYRLTGRPDGLLNLDARE